MTLETPLTLDFVRIIVVISRNHADALERVRDFFEYLSGRLKLRIESKVGEVSRDANMVDLELFQTLHGVFDDRT